MKIDLMTAISLVSVLNLEIQKSFQDKQLTVGEVYDIIGTVIERLGLKDQVIFQKD